MTTRKPGKAKTADPKAALRSTIEAAEGVFAKHKAKAGNDPKRRLALKKLKRAQRQLGKIVGMEKKAAAAAKKAEGAAD